MGRRPASVKLDAYFFLRQVEALERGDDTECDIWDHADFQILKDNATLREKLLAALRAITAYEDAAEAVGKLTWRDHMLKAQKCADADATRVQAIIQKTETVKAYEMFRRLAAYDNKSLDLSVYLSKSL